MKYDRFHEIYSQSQLLYEFLELVFFDLGVVGGDLGNLAFLADGLRQISHSSCVSDRIITSAQIRGYNVRTWLPLPSADFWYDTFISCTQCSSTHTHTHTPELPPSVSATVMKSALSIKRAFHLFLTSKMFCVHLIMCDSIYPLFATYICAFNFISGH